MSFESYWGQEGWFSTNPFEATFPKKLPLYPADLNIICPGIKVAILASDK